MTPDERSFVADLCAQRAGLRIDLGKAYVIESRLAPAARREGFPSVGALVEAAREGRESGLPDVVVEAMAASESRFFRDRDLIERLWREVIPAIARQRDDGVVRLWSAGCGAGQEIYSLAMLQDEQPAPTGRVQLFASDISERLLERARSGIYSSFEVQRGLTARQLVRHFENHETSFQVAQKLREQVRWRRINLVESLAAVGTFDVILCRNVAGAMTPEAQGKLMAQLAQVLAPGGVLMLGRNDPPPGPLFVDEGGEEGGIEGVFRPAARAQEAA
jgi:chemotaxis protein methyltransferase CheR